MTQANRDEAGSPPLGNASRTQDAPEEPGRLSHFRILAFRCRSWLSGFWRLRSNESGWRIRLVAIGFAALYLAIGLRLAYLGSEGNRRRR